MHLDEVEEKKREAAERKRKRAGEVEAIDGATAAKKAK